MAEPTKHEIKLNNITAKYLSDLLQSMDWTRTTADVVLAGQILVDKLPANLDKEARKIGTDEEKLEEWMAKPVNFTLSEKQREVCKFVIENFAKKGKLPPNKYGGMLCSAFGFSVEEEAPAA
jgi:hypothetical protein